LIFKNYGDGTFTREGAYVAGDAPYSVFCADLDGDWDLDLVVASYNDDSISVLKNRGDGTFQSRIDYAVGQTPHSVFCTDLDGDFDFDIAVVNYYEDNVSVLKNNGNCTFQTQVDYQTGDGPYSVYGGDLDGDSSVDLVVSNFGDQNLSVLKNNGDGTFQPESKLGTGDRPSSVFCADLDGDSDLDIVSTNWSSNDVSILLNLTRIPNNQPPVSFSLLFPPNKTYTPRGVRFDWENTTDPNPYDQVRYDLYVSTSYHFPSDLTTIDSNLTKSDVGKVLSYGNYFWKVKAKDNYGGETWSDQIRYFTVREMHDSPIGDLNLDGSVDVSDVLYLANYLYRSGLAPDPVESGDVNHDTEVNIADVIYLINYLYAGGLPPEG
jgi:hypothetical protein